MNRGFEKNEAGEWVPFDDDLNEDCCSVMSKEIELLRDQLARARKAAYEECAAVAQQWADDAAEFNRNERCRVQENVCRNLATALRNKASRI